VLQLDGKATERGGQSLAQRLSSAGFTHNATLELIKPRHFEQADVPPASAVAAATM
jgi:hypothetical protein